MTISRSDWQGYIDQLARIKQRAGELMESWIDNNPEATGERLVETSYALATQYGEAAASLACDMYDEIAAAQGANVPPAEPAPTATYGETAKAVYGTMMNQQNTVPATVGRLVKQAGADTMLQNAARDGAEFAWIPMGDTCAFCLTLASRGWQRQSKKARDRHASHIHANCDCEYCVRFDGKSTVAGYDPDALREKYDSFEGTPDEKINAWRREIRAENAPTIRAQQRAAYERNRRLNYGAANTFDTDRGSITARRVDRYGYNNIYVDEKVTLTERQLRKVDWQVSEAKRLVGVTNTCDARVIVTDMGDRLAAYNPRTNTMLISTRLKSDEEIIKAQEGFACPKDPRSTVVHEMVHWMDADEYRRAGRVIESSEFTSPYVRYRCEEGWERLIDAGFDMMDGDQIQSEISEYAWEKIRVDNDFDEAYTEYRTKRALEG